MFLPKISVRNERSLKHWGKKLVVRIRPHEQVMLIIVLTTHNEILLMAV